LKTEELGGLPVAGRDLHGPGRALHLDLKKIEVKEMKPRKLLVNATRIDSNRKFAILDLLEGEGGSGSFVRRISE
jgi:hypothetical protein